LPNTKGAIAVAEEDVHCIKSVKLRINPGHGDIEVAA
jgi:hypothetical protein